MKNILISVLIYLLIVITLGIIGNIDLHSILSELISEGFHQEVCNGPIECKGRGMRKFMVLISGIVITFLSVFIWLLEKIINIGKHN